MKNPRVKHYFGKNSPSCEADEKTKLHDKQIIETIKQSIAGKLKDPAMAKKAAQILSDMLEKERENESSTGS